jgi:hypothetical protein
MQVTPFGSDGVVWEVVGTVCATMVLSATQYSVAVVNVSTGAAWASAWFPLCLAGAGDSGEAERSFRTETERHSGMIPNTIGA